MPSFPTTVDDTAGRITAGLVAATSIAAVVVWPLAALVAIDLALRHTLGPRHAPLSRLAMATAQRLGLARRPTPGPPKRFAALIGASLASLATLAGAAGASAAAVALLAVLVTCAALEASVGFCVGCLAYRRLSAWGWVASSPCAECADISSRAPASPSH